MSKQHWHKMHWCCWHHGTVSDPRYRLVAKRTGQPVAVILGVWAAALEEASQASERGNLSDLDPAVVGLALDLDPDTVTAVVDAMRGVGLVADGKVAKWDEKQHVRADPTNAERQRRYREGSSEPGNVTARYVTAQDRTGQDTQDRTYKTGQDNESPSHALTSVPPLRGLAREEGTIADLNIEGSPDLRAEAIKVVQDMQPGADPAALLSKFIQKMGNRRAPGWRKSLATFAKQEWIEDDERRAGQYGITGGAGPRMPGEPLPTYRQRVGLLKRVSG